MPAAMAAADIDQSKAPMMLGEKPTPAASESKEFSVVEEIGNMLSLSLPMYLSMVAGIVGSMVGMVIVGHCLGETALSGMALGNTFSSCTSMLTVFGMVEAMDVLCAQAYGAKNGRLVSQLLQRGVLLVTIMCVPLALIWLFTGPILLMLGQSPLLAMEAGAYNAVKTPMLFLQISSSCCLRYLFAQRFTTGMAAMSIGTTGLGICMLFAAAHLWNLGLVGVAMAFNTSGFISTCGITFLVWYRHHLATNSNGEMLITWHGIDCPAMWRDWNEFIKLALPCTVMSASEILLLEVASIFAGLLPNAVSSVASANICMMFQCMLFMFPMSCGSAAGCRVGNMLGAGNAEHAGKMLRTSTIMMLSMWSLVACVLISYRVRYSIGALFLGSSTSDEGVDTSALIAKCLGFVLFDNLFDGLKEVQNGIIRGCARQNLGLISSVIAYVFIGLPTSLALAFQWHQSWCPGVSGLFCGQMIGSAVHAVINFVIINTIDFEYEVRRVAKITAAGGKGSGKNKDKD